MTIDLPVAALGGEVRLLASGRGDAASPVAAVVTLDGGSVRPPAPVALAFDPATRVVRWVRRSRAGFRWSDGRDVPLGEESEAYRITATAPSGVARTYMTTGPSCVIDADVAGAGTAIVLRQAGTMADSVAARLILS